jgi:CDGSH-type Zn-finger protein
MIVEEQRLVCSNHECGAEIVIKKKPTIERQNLFCTCGSELKKPYHSPVLAVYGSVVRECPKKC